MPEPPYPTPPWMTESPRAQESQALPSPLSPRPASSHLLWSTGSQATQRETLVQTADPLCVWQEGRALASREM